jgi:hypothetical protein
MRRREFIMLLGGTAISWPFVARGQQPLPVIGYVRSEAFDSTAQRMITGQLAMNDRHFCAALADK